MKTATARSLSLLSLLAGLMIVTNPLLAQGMGGGKDKEPVLHEVFTVQYSNPGNQSAVVLGPFAADTSLEVFAVTSNNRSQFPIAMQMRAIQPVTPPTAWQDCVGGAAGVFDELASAVLSPYSAMHQTFPEPAEIPGDSSKDAVFVGAPTGPWCLTVFADALIGVDYDDTLGPLPRINGHIYFRVNEAE